MTFFWLVVGVVSLFLFPQRPDEFDKLFDVALKTAAGIAGFSIFIIFAYDRAPSTLDWTPATFVWAFFMVGAGLMLKSDRPVDEDDYRYEDE